MDTVVVRWGLLSEGWQAGKEADKTRDTGLSGSLEIKERRQLCRRLRLKRETQADCELKSNSLSLPEPTLCHMNAFAAPSI